MVSHPQTHDNATGLHHPHSAPATGPRECDAYDLMLAGTSKPLQWLVPGVLPRYFMLMGADAKAGKSRLALTCALKIATSHPDVGAPPKVLYISPDNTDRDEWQENINELLGGVPLEPGRLIVWFDTAGTTVGGGLTELIEQRVKSDPAIVLVVVDVLNSVKSAKRDGDDIQRSDHKGMRPFAQLAERYGIGVALLTHTNVRGQIAGSMGLRGGVHGLMKLEREEFGSTVFVHLRGRRIKQDIRFKFTLGELSVYWEAPTEEERQEQAEDLEEEYRLAIQERAAQERKKLPHVPGAIEQKLLDALQDGNGWAPKLLADTLNLRHGTVREYLRRMAQRGSVTLACYGVYKLAVTPVTVVTLPNIPALTTPQESLGVTRVTRVTMCDTPPKTEYVGAKIRRYLAQGMKPKRAEELALAELKAELQT